MEISSKVILKKIIPSGIIAGSIAIASTSLVSHCNNDIERTNFCAASATDLCLSTQYCTSPQRSLTDSINTYCLGSHDPEQSTEFCRQTRYTCTNESSLCAKINTYCYDWRQ